MKHDKIVELQGEVLELREENRLLKNQLNIQNGITYGKNTKVHY